MFFRIRKNINGQSNHLHNGEEFPPLKLASILASIGLSLDLMSDHHRVNPLTMDYDNVASTIQFKIRTYIRIFILFFLSTCFYFFVLISFEVYFPELFLTSISLLFFPIPQEKGTKRLTNMKFQYKF